MEPEDGGYATTDEELDSDDEGGVELDLKMWLSQLDSPTTTSSQTKLPSLKKTKPSANSSSAASRTSKTEKQEEIDFDSILGQLSSLDEQFNDLRENDSSFSKPTPSKQSPPAKALHSKALGETKISDDFGDINSQLMDAIFELNKLVDDDVGAKNKDVLPSVEATRTKVQQEVQPVVETSQRHVASQGVSVSQLRRQEAPPSNDGRKVLPEKTNSRKPPLNAARTSVKSDVFQKEETVSLKSTDSGSSRSGLNQPQGGARLSGRSAASENLPQVCVKVFSPDGSSKSVLVDKCTTVGHLCEILIEKNLADRSRTWGITELIPDLFMQRLLEDHQLILQETCNWSKETNNRLVFLEAQRKYEMFNKFQFLNEEQWEPTQLEGWLHLKSDGKKAWKKWSCFLRNGEISYNARGKGKVLSVYKSENIRVEYKRRFLRQALEKRCSLC